MKIKNFTIYGERCTGTNYLELLIEKNFGIPVTWDYGWKHYFGYANLSASNETLFLGIVRHPLDWLNSFWNQPHHVVYSAKKDKESFLNEKIWSIYDSGDTENKHDFGKDIPESYHLIEKNRPYNNIFELRKTKAEFLFNTMPFSVQNYHFIKYEDLKNELENTLQVISQKFHLSQVNPEIQNITTYKKECAEYIEGKTNQIFSVDDIINKIDLKTEKLIGYNL